MRRTLRLRGGNGGRRVVVHAVSWVEDGWVKRRVVQALFGFAAASLAAIVAAHVENNGVMVRRGALLRARRP